MKKATKSNGKKNTQQAAAPAATPQAAAPAPAPAPAAQPVVDPKTAANISQMEKVVAGHEAAIAKGDLKGEALEKRKKVLEAAKNTLAQLKTGSTATPNTAPGVAPAAPKPAGVTERKNLTFADLKVGGLYLADYPKGHPGQDHIYVGRFPFYVTHINKSAGIVMVLYRYALRNVGGRVTSKADEPLQIHWIESEYTIPNTSRVLKQGWYHFGPKVAGYPIFVQELSADEKTKWAELMKQKDEYDAEQKKIADAKAAAAAPQVAPAPAAPAAAAPEAAPTSAPKKKTAKKKAA